MSRSTSSVVAGLLLSGAVCAVSFARDEPPPPAPAPKADEKPAPPAAKPPADAAAEEASDKKAREILAKAAVRQNAGDLSEPGKLESFHVVFSTAVFEREKTNDAGERVASDMIQTDDDGLVVDWKLGSIKTKIVVDGNATTKAWLEWTKSGWFNDGKKSFPLTGDRKSDLDQLQFHRRVVAQLLDVAILGKLLTDKSRWSLAADAAPREKTVAIRRSRTADAPDALPIVLWVENPAESEFGDVVAAAIPPSEPGAPSLLYDFKYHAEFPKVSRAAADGAVAETKMRFPFEVDVFESEGDGKTKRKVLHVATREVTINTVVDDDFKPPTKSR